MLRLIVVPLDGSAFSEQVLPLAIRLSERHHAELELVHVFEALAPYLVQGAPPLDPALDADLRRDRQEHFDSLADHVRRATAVTVDVRVLSGTEVVTTLAEHLAERHADLAVMATHGRGGLSRLWIGSVATGVVRRSDTPVLLVRPDQSAPPNVKAIALRHVLLPLDGTPADDEALDDAIAVADVDGAEFLLLNVRQPVVYFDERVVTPLAAAEGVESAMKEYLDEVARRIRARGFSATTHVILDPSPATAILQFAGAWKIDLIVMETHARTGVSRVLHGSVTDKVIRGAHVPVLVRRRRAESNGRAAGASADAAAGKWS